MRHGCTDINARQPRPAPDLKLAGLILASSDARQVGDHSTALSGQFTVSSRPLPTLPPIFASERAARDSGQTEIRPSTWV